MAINVSDYLTTTAKDAGIDLSGLQLPAMTLDPERIAVIMINEVPPSDPVNGFYSDEPGADDLVSALSLFDEAGVDVRSMDGLLDLGIYLTTAVKTPKDAYAVPTERIVEHLPILEAELDLFPNLRAIMLMGDVAKKAFNRIARARTGKAAIPSGSTYKIRDGEFFYRDIRVFPSYIMTGGNIRIEKSKRTMIADDIQRMMALLSGAPS